MKKHFRLWIILLAVSLLSDGCGIVTPSHHRTEDYTPVFAAASGGDIDAVKVAFQKDRSILTATAWDDETLLHVSVQQNRKNVAEFLLKEGVDVNATAKGRVTPLHMAAQNGNNEIVQILLDAKAKINAVDEKGWTPVDRANKWRHPGTATYLKERGGHGLEKAPGRPSKEAP